MLILTYIEFGCYFCILKKIRFKGGMVYLSYLPLIS